MCEIVQFPLLYYSINLNLSKFAKTTKLHTIFLFTKFFVPTVLTHGHWTVHTTYPHWTVPISRSSSDFAKKLNFGQCQESFHFSYYLCVCTRTSYKYWSWINNISINAHTNTIYGKHNGKLSGFWFQPPPPSPRAIGSWKWKSFRERKGNPPHPHPTPSHLFSVFDWDLRTSEAFLGFRCISQRIQTAYVAFK